MSSKNSVNLTSDIPPKRALFDAMVRTGQVYERMALTASILTMKAIVGRRQVASLVLI